MPTGPSGRESILETSAKLFNEQGYKGVSIRDIAQACGMTNAALYYHFKNKDDLFLAVLERTHRQTIEALDKAAQPMGDLREDLKRLLLCYADIVARLRHSFQTLGRDLKQMGDARGHKFFGRMRTDSLRPLAQLIESAQAEGQVAAGNATLYARLLHGMLVALTFGGEPGRPARLSPEDVDVVLDVFLDGVRNET